MDLFDVLTLLGGLSLFLFGMNLMGQALERSAGSSLEVMLGRLTSNRFAGLLTGLGVTAIIQSSSATTVMVVGFVNSGLMSLKQAINVIMGANIGTTVTAWIISLGGISSENIVLKLLKPTSFSPILAVIGIALYMFAKSNKKKDIGTILLGFATLMFGMDTMTGAVAGLADVPEFQNLFLMFKNPILGVVAGAVLTAIIQSSSASVGILQALTVTGSVSYGAAIPIIMGQNIGTCITAILSSFGTNKNAKRAAIVHLSFNVIGTIAWLTTYWIADLIFSPAIFDEAATQAGIAVAHSLFNILCTILLFPMAGLLEKLANKLVPDSKLPEELCVLDERLLATPAIALERAKHLTVEMARISTDAVRKAISLLSAYDESVAKEIREAEDKTDNLEDSIGAYLVKLSTRQLIDEDSREVTKLLKLIGDYERICDHAVNVLESAEELRSKKITFTPDGERDISKLYQAVCEIVLLAESAFCEGNKDAARAVEPLEEIVDVLRERLRTGHINRLRAGNCSIEAGFVWSDLLTNLERVSDHCANVAESIILNDEIGTHESVRVIKADDPGYRTAYLAYSAKYLEA